MRKILFLAIILLIPKAHAQEQFETSYSILYSIDQTGLANVTQNITITNKQNDVIATSYSLNLKQIDVENVSAYDSKGKLDYKVVQQQGDTTINVTFDRQVIGADRKNNFTIYFETNDITNKIGGVWNIGLPKAAAGEYTISLSVPNEFGSEIFVSPAPDNKTSRNNSTVYKFNKDILSTSPVSASFGRYQIINFELKYQLENTTSLSSIQKIALPSDITNQQQVSIASLTPVPSNTELDQDSNIIATYALKPHQRLTVTLTGSARLMGKQINPQYGGAFSQIPKDLINKYTRSQKYWETNSTEIKNLAIGLVDKNKNVAENALTVYKYVTAKLQYDFDTTKKEFIQRNGALKALTTQGSWACMEFTDSFIALARAMGIPAREVDGHAFTTNDKVTPLSIDLKTGDVLHSWVQFFDPNFGWVSIDPTWGSTSGLDYFTKLDTNHFSFVIHGVNSEFPLPAGEYRFSDNAQKLTSVDFSAKPDDSDFKTQLVLYKTINLNPIELLKGNDKFYLYNTGSVSVYMDTPLVPYSKRIVYLPKENTTIKYTNFNGIPQTETLTVSGYKNPSLREIPSTLVIFISGISCVFVVVRLRLYRIFYRPASLLKFLRK